jgi:hypothetical protein
MVTSLKLSKVCVCVCFGGGLHSLHSLLGGDVGGGVTLFTLFVADCSGCGYGGGLSAAGTLSMIDMCKVAIMDIVKRCKLLQRCGQRE